MTQGHPGHGKRWVLAWTPPAGIAARARVLGRSVAASPVDALPVSGALRVESPAGFLSFGIGGPDAAEPARLEQVHGNRVAVVTAPGVTRATDAAVTRVPGLPLTVRTADCVPVFLAAPAGVAVVHAGWRGTAAEITLAAARELLALTGHRPSDLAAFIGPSIGPCCYDVGPEVAAEFDPVFLLAPHPGRSDRAAAIHGTAPPADAGRRPRLDLWRANRAQLEAAGIPAARILEARICTRCHQHLYHSHRGSGGKKGRIDAAITLGNQAPKLRSYSST